MKNKAIACDENKQAMTVYRMKNKQSPKSEVNFKVWTTKWKRFITKAVREMLFYEVSLHERLLSWHCLGTAFIIFFSEKGNVTLYQGTLLSPLSDNDILILSVKRRGCFIIFSVFSIKVMLSFLTTCQETSEFYPKLRYSHFLSVEGDEAFFCYHIR